MLPSGTERVTPSTAAVRPKWRVKCSVVIAAFILFFPVFQALPVTADRLYEVFTFEIEFAGFHDESFDVLTQQLSELFARRRRSFGDNRADAGPNPEEVFLHQGRNRLL